MPRHLLRAVFLLLALLAGTLGVAAPALAVDTPFSVRFAQTVRGSINAVGNQLLTCPAAAAGCTAARNRTGPVGTMNNNYNMGYVDVDGDATTVNSSTSTLALPAGATVAWAGLYWGADTAAGTGGSAAPNAANNGSVRFKVGSGGYQTVTAAPADVLTSTGKASRYRAFANVTGLLPAAGNATYTVADVQTGRGDDRFAGWSLVVAYQDPTEGFHRVSVYDGLGTVDATHTFSTDIFPFYTPASGSVATKTGLLAFEGDAGIVGETATFNGTDLTDAINGPGNLMNSTMARDGTLFTDKNPNYANLQGTDIDVWNNTGLLDNHQSTATLAFASNQDLFVPSALWLVSDEGPASNTAGPTVGGLARDGSTLTANPGSWDGTPTITYDYQWQRCDASGNNCVDIPGATSATYTLGAADVGSTVRVLVTAVNDAGPSAPSASPPTTTITQLPPSNVTLPALSGTQQDGQTLTTTIGGWNGTAPLDYDVQWQRCDAVGANCVDIAGAIAWSYVLTGADVGSRIRSEVTASNSAGFATAVSVPTSTVVPDPPANTTVPTTSGTVRDGEVLTAASGNWTGTGPIDYDYQWERCDAAGANCQPIVGATDPTYTLEDADAGQTVRVVVTGTNAAGFDTATSAPTTTVDSVEPANAAPPTISGTVRDGQTLTVDDGDWTGTGPLTTTYQWQRCDADGTDCVDIAGATDDTYTPTGGDIGHAIVAVVTATNPGGSTSQASAPTTPVLAAPPVNTAVPTITGTPEDGGTLTVDPGTWSGTSPIDYEYQWQRCDADGTDCTDIAGATDETYTPDAGDIDHTITVVVTAGNAGGEDTAVAVVTPVIVASPPRDTTPPAVTGDVGDGDTLTADPGVWSGTDPIDYTYQWQRCDEDGTNCVDVAGATDATYTLGAADLGHAMVVVVTATNAVDSDTSASPPTLVPAPPVNTAAPSISGDPEVGETLTADPGTWTGTGPIAHDYQWQRCDFFGANCVDIAGATDDTYTLTAADLGHTIHVVVGASNAAGSAAAGAPTTPAVDDPAPTPTPTPTATPTPTPAKRPPSSSPGVSAGPHSSDFAFASGGAGADLGSVPGSLVGDTSCQQLAGNSKYSRVKAKGIGTVRVRAYATGPATKVSPVLVTTQISGGKAKKVTYKLDGRKLKAKRGKSWKSAITPAKLQKVGIHTLKATVKGRKKGAKSKVVKLKLKTVPCRTLFTAQRWRTTAGAGLRLRIDARTAMQRVSFTVAAPLLPRQMKKARTIGFMRVFVAGERGRRRYSLKLAKKGSKKPLVAGVGKPTVKLRKGKIDVSGLPAGAAVTELTLYRVKKLDGTTKRRVFKLRARVAPTGGTLSVRPKAPR